MSPSHIQRDRLIDRTLEVWQPRLGRDLSREDARQIVENVTGFFRLLIEWSRTEVPSPANFTGGPSRRIRAGGENHGECLVPMHKIREIQP